MRTVEPSLAQNLRRDAMRYVDFSCNRPLDVRAMGLLVLAPEFRLIVAFRVYSWLHRRGRIWTAHVLYSLTKSRTACDLAPSARIGPGLRIEHRSDIVIGPGAVIGNDVCIFNGVTIGKRRAPLELEMPHIADRVMIGTGAKVLGAVRIGCDAIIGANAVVLYDVPSGTTAVGVPAHNISTRLDTQPGNGER